MKKVLFILYEYYPYGSAITNCLKAIIEDMLAKKIEVSVVTRRNYASLKKHEFLNGVEVYRINDYFNIYTNKINSCSSKFKGIFYRIIRKIIYNYRKILKKDGFMDYSKSCKLANKIVKNGYDVIISCSYPMMMHKIANNVKKNNNIKWISYQFDPHSFNYTLDQNLIEERIKEEINFFSICDGIFLPYVNYYENINSKLSALKDKYYPFEFALINKNNVENNFKGDKIRFVFTGTFYDNIRIPDYMLDFFKNVKFDYELILCYICENNIKNKLLKYKNEFGDKLILNEKLSKSECDEFLKSANIIVNVGNEIINQVPSKVYEYISYGKPIVNFYSNIDDTSKKILDKYPLVFNVYKEFYENDIIDFEKFCEVNRNSYVGFDEISRNYKMANEVASDFVEKVGEIIENK